MNPDIAEVVDYGDSYLKTTSGGTTGYDLKALRITNPFLPGPKSVLFLVAGYHGDEVQGPEIAMRMAAWLVNGYGRDADATWLIDWHDIWVVPTANPDRLGSSRNNANGVNLNRNHSFMWISAAGHGTGPASEPEVAALEALIPTLIPDQRGPGNLDPAAEDATGIFLTVHTPWNAVLYPWTHTDDSAPNHAGLERIAKKLATYTDYGARQSPYLPGAASDWVYGTLGSPAFLYELEGPSKPPYELVDSEVWPINKGALIYAAKIAQTPYLTAKGPDVLTATTTTFLNEVTLTADVDDSNNGGQIIAEAEAYLDIPPWEPGAVSIPLTAADGAFDTPRESVTATIITSGLSVDQHILYVRGRDQADNWGPVSAVFLDLRPNEPPSIDLALPGTHHSMESYTAETFEVSVFDPDGDLLEFSWTLDDKPVFHCGEPSHSYAPTDDDIGVRRLTVSIFDGRVTDSHTWQISVTQNQTLEIVDNRDSNTAQTGPWSTSAAAGFWETDSVYSNDGGTFTWSPDLPTSTTYAVYAWWTSNPTRSTTVPYRITHNGGTATVIVDQLDPTLGSQWNLLGTYTLTSGINGDVTVSSESGQANADAVRFVRSGSVPPNLAPIADLAATPTSGDAPLMVEFDASGSDDPDGDPITFSWDFGDGTSGSGTIVNHTFSASGSYTTTLVVTDPQGAADSATTIIDVTATPGTEVIVDNLDVNTEQTGTWKVSSGANPYSSNSVYSDVGGTFTWTPALPTSNAYDVYAWWTYHQNRSTTVPYRIVHNGGTATVIVNQHDSALAGQWHFLGRYELTSGVNGEVTVSSESGQANADAVRFVSADSTPPNTPPIADLFAAPTSGDAPLVVEFDASGSDDPDDDPVTYSWDFGDEKSGAGMTLTHMYSASGSYAVTLVVTDSHGAKDSASVSIDVTAPPGAEVIVDNLAANTRQTGIWKISTGLNPYDTSSVYSDADGTFTWEPALPDSGAYDVYAWWTYHANRSTTVPYRIAHDSGIATVIVNQHDQALAGRWNRLGTYEFSPGVNGEVTVTSESGQANADAVRFVPTDAPAPGPEVIVDNRDANTDQTGVWSVSSGANPYAGNSVYSNADGTFTWQPGLTISGTYDVYAWWTYHQNRSLGVPYRITHDNGTATVVVNQRDQGLAGQWNLLGTYEFTQGLNGQVEVSSENGQANADAVRFVGR